MDHGYSLDSWISMCVFSIDDSTWILHGRCHAERLTAYERLALLVLSSTKLKGCERECEVSEEWR